MDTFLFSKSEILPTFLLVSLVPGATIVAPTDHLHDHGYFCPTDKTSDQEGDLLILADDDDLSTKSNCK